MTVGNKWLASQQTLVWDDENRLSQVQDSNGDMVEQYWYDVDGGRVKKVSGNITTYTFFGHYEEEVTGGVTTTVSHYSFGGLRFAVKRGSDLYHLHGDHLGSTSLTTRGSTVEASRAYYAYGAARAAAGNLQTDRTFTGQKSDATGLMYYNARYYDPALGTFISPDTLIPDSNRVIDHNRFAYARANPLRYSDPSGNIPSDLPDSPKGTPPGADPWVVDLYWKNRWYNARGWGYSHGHWSRPIRPIFEDMEILHEVIREDLVGWLIREMKGNIEDERLKKIAKLNEIYGKLHKVGLGGFPGPLAIKGEALRRWAALVKQRAPWDYKGHIGEATGRTYYNSYGLVSYYYDVWANINYGYAGRAAGFTQKELLRGAGMGQLVSDLKNYHRPQHGKSSNFDDPADQAAVWIGIALYDVYGADITRAAFRQIFMTQSDNLQTPP